jgi:hypothetical protein
MFFKKWKLAKNLKMTCSPDMSMKKSSEKEVKKKLANKSKGMSNKK